MADEIIRIVDEKGVHPNRLDQIVLEQELYRKGQFVHLNDQNSIFVFGSNEAGYHGAGAASYAHKKLDAKFHLGYGRSGSCFAVPTKDHKIRTLPLGSVRAYIQDFIIYAEADWTNLYKVTQLGCGLAGFTAEQIAPMFTRAPINCIFDTAWLEWFPDKMFWGTVP